MVGLEHIFLHVGLCSAIAHAPPETPIAMRVRMSFRVGDPQFDKTFRFTTGDEAEHVVEFDIPRNLYRLQVDVPKYGCSVSEYIQVLSDNNRTITETLSAGPVPPPSPVVLLDGTAPISFVYVKPTFVLFDKSMACNQPIQSPLPSHINVEYDQGAYYAWLYSDSSYETHAPVVVAVRLKTPTGTAHYVHLPVPFPVPWAGWPGTIRFDVTEEMIDSLATEKVDTLLCPKLWGTSAR